MQDVCLFKYCARCRSRSHSRTGQLSLSPSGGPHFTLRYEIQSNSGTSDLLLHLRSRHLGLVATGQVVSTSIARCLRRALLRPLPRVAPSSASRLLHRRPRRLLTLPRPRDRRLAAGPWSITRCLRQALLRAIPRVASSPASCLPYRFAAVVVFAVVFLLLVLCALFVASCRVCVVLRHSVFCHAVAIWFCSMP